MTETNIIYTGIDQLDFTVDGIFHDGFMKILKTGQEFARETDMEQLVEFGNFKGLVGATGGKGGWNYIVNNETATFAIKNRGQAWSLKVSIRSILLASKKYKGSIASIVAQIKEFYTIKDYRVSRVDVACDCQPNNFKIVPELFVKRGQMTMSEYYAFNENGKPYLLTGDEYKEFKETNTIQCGRVFRKKNIETVMLGKLPNFQVCIYNKSIQINKSPKFEYWRSVWQQNPEYKPERPVWRFEFRFGRQFFKVRRINDFTDFRREIGKIIYTATREIYVIDKPVKNISRDGRTCGHWQAIRNTLFSFVNNLTDDIPKLIDMREQLKAIKHRKNERNEKTIIGLTTSILAMNGETKLDFEKLKDKLGNQLEHILDDKDKRTRMLKEFARKKAEYEYLEYGLVEDLE